MYGTLISLAINVGAPLVERLLSERIGKENTRLATQVVEAIARRVGVLPEALEEHARAHPDETMEAIRTVEDMAPDFVALALEETRVRERLLLAETVKGGWKAAWRPAWMFMLGFLWVWNVVVLHVLNAVFKIALPPVDAAVLLQLTAIFAGLYMGGHTVKEAVKSWRGHQ